MKRRWRGLFLHCIIQRAFCRLYLTVSSILMVCSALFLFPAQHHCLSQPSRPKWLAIPAGRHGGAPLHVAPGERGANGWHSGAQGPACGAAWRGEPFSYVFDLSHCVIFDLSLDLLPCFCSSVASFSFKKKKKTHSFYPQDAENIQTCCKDKNPVWFVLELRLSEAPEALQIRPNCAVSTRQLQQLCIKMSESQSSFPNTVQPAFTWSELLTSFFSWSRLLKETREVADGVML